MSNGDIRISEGLHKGAFAGSSHAHYRYKYMVEIYVIGASECFSVAGLQSLNLRTYSEYVSCPSFTFDIRTFIVTDV